LDDLVGYGQQRFRDGEAECFGGLEIDHQLELGRLHSFAQTYRRRLSNEPDIPFPMAAHHRETSTGTGICASNVRVAPLAKLRMTWAIEREPLDATATLGERRRFSAIRLHDTVLICN
jgi:hypothetical protein